jgi:hypothetical protein
VAARAQRSRQRFAEMARASRQQIFMFDTPHAPRDRCGSLL